MRDDETRLPRARLELFASVLIGFAAVLTAVATYQGSELDDVVRAANTEALAETSFANDRYNDSNARQAIERDWFFGWLIEFQNDRAAADYMEGAMPTEVWALIEEWNTADDDILNPFSPEAVATYEAYGALPSIEFLRLGNEHMAYAQCAMFRGGVAENLGDWVGLSSVFLAITLVTAGLAGPIRSRAAQFIVLAVAVSALLVGAGLMAVGGDTRTAEFEVAAEVFGIEVAVEEYETNEELANVIAACPDPSANG